MPVCHPHGARFLHAAVPRHPGGHRGRNWEGRAQWGQGGILGRARSPWPSDDPHHLGDDARSFIKKSYYPDDFKGKYYLAGDGAIRDEKTGYFTITGRIDDVLNVSGHRMGTMEIESALVSCTELVAEAAVVGRPDDTTGEAVVRVRGAETSSARRGDEGQGHRQTTA